VAANAIANVPTTGAASEAIHGIVASGTASVAYLFPG
jgi:hypothetical protein